MSFFLESDKWNVRKLRIQTSGFFQFLFGGLSLAGAIVNDLYMSIAGRILLWVSGNVVLVQIHIEVRILVPMS